MWASIQQVSKIYAKPERTLRHYAAQGKIIVRKNNRSWECDLASVEKLGWTRTEYRGFEKNKLNDKYNNQENANHNSVASSLAVSKEPTLVSDENKAPKKFILSNLGIYNELLGLTQKIKNDVNNSDDGKALFENAFKSIQSIGYGFYTFDKTSKVHHFSQARNYLINLLIQIEVHGLLSDSDVIKKQVEESILPGLGGLIRRAEKKNQEGRPHDKNFRSANLAKN